MFSSSSGDDWENIDKFATNTYFVMPAVILGGTIMGVIGGIIGIPFWILIGLIGSGTLDIFSGESYLIKAYGKTLNAIATARDKKYNSIRLKIFTELEKNTDAVISSVERKVKNAIDSQMEDILKKAKEKTDFVLLSLK